MTTKNVQEDVALLPQRLNKTRDSEESRLEERSRSLVENFSSEREQGGGGCKRIQ